MSHSTERGFDKFKADMARKFGDEVMTEDGYAEGYVEFVVIEAIKNAIAILGPHYVKVIVEKELTNVQ